MLALETDRPSRHRWDGAADSISSPLPGRQTGCGFNSDLAQSLPASRQNCRGRAVRTTDVRSSANTHSGLTDIVILTYDVDHRQSYPLADFHPQIHYAHKHLFSGRWNANRVMSQIQVFAALGVMEDSGQVH